MASKRRATDWEAIEREYRAGQISVNEIAREHGVTPQALRGRAKRNGWQRDLSGQVREAVRAKLAAADVSPGVSPRHAGKIIDTASDRGVAVTLTHRRDLADLRTRRDAMLARFDEMLPGAETPRDLATLSDVLSDAAAITGRLIPLERQAFNLDDPHHSTDDAYTAEQKRKAAELYLEG